VKVIIAVAAAARNPTTAVMTYLRNGLIIDQALAIIDTAMCYKVPPSARFKGMTSSEWQGG